MEGKQRKFPLPLAIAVSLLRLRGTRLGARWGVDYSLAKEQPGRASTPGHRGREKTQALYSKGVCCVFLHKKTRQVEGGGVAK